MRKVVVVGAPLRAPPKEATKCCPLLGLLIMFFLRPL